MAGLHLAQGDCGAPDSSREFFLGQAQRLPPQFDPTPEGGRIFHCRLPYSHSPGNQRSIHLDSTRTIRFVSLLYRRPVSYQAPCLTAPQTMKTLRVFAPLRELFSEQWPSNGLAPRVASPIFW